MNSRPSSIAKPIGLLVFLATAVIGWKLATPSGRVVLAKEEETKPIRRTSRLEASDSARARIGSLRAIVDPEARLLATIALANSLSPDDFAAWMDGRWFTLRGGHEHLLFDRILMERWRNEAPESLLEWSAKNKNMAAAAVAKEWAENQPERLLEFFKTHRDDAAEMSALALIARNSPELALARLQEMISAGLIGTSESASGGVLQALLEKSPGTLLDILGTLPPAIKLTVEGMMSRKRLEASFPEEIRSLWDRPDGWRIFSAAGIDEKMSEKLLGELANLPQEWRVAIASNSWDLFEGGNGEKWYDADLEGAGFSPETARSIRLQAVRFLAQRNPEAAITRVVAMDLEPAERKDLLDRAFSRVRDPEKLRALIPLLPTGEERETVTKKLQAITATEKDIKPATPEDLLAKLSKTDADFNSAYRDFSELQNWDPQKLSQLTARFKELPGEKKQQVAKVIITNAGRDNTTTLLKGDAIRYLLENPPVKVENEDPWQSTSFASSNYAVNLSGQDPEAATAWVKTLPAGEEKSWTQKNLYNNWKQYDPKAAEQWKKSLPAAELVALEKLKGM
jgi:hypothetical protein